MKVLLEPCYILHRRDWRESSLLITAFSREHGRIELLAKGAKRDRNRNAHLFRFWQGLRLSWTAGRNINTLIGIESDGECGLSGTERICCGFYLNELLLRLLQPGESFPALFNEYQCCLLTLGAGGCIESALRHFEKALLAGLGYGLTLDRETAHDMPLDVDATYWYIPELGPRAAPMDGKGLRISGRALLALARNGLDSEGKPVQAEVKRLMRFALAPHLKGQALASQDLYGHWLSVQASEGTPS